MQIRLVYQGFSGHTVKFDHNDEFLSAQCHCSLQHKQDLFFITQDYYYSEQLDLINIVGKMKTRIKSSIFSRFVIFSRDALRGKQVTCALCLLSRGSSGMCHRRSDRQPVPAQSFNTRPRLPRRDAMWLAGFQSQSSVGWMTS